MSASIDQPSEVRLLKSAAASAMAKVYTSLPGIVVSYDETKRTAVVQPAAYDSAEPHQPIEDVPVLFPRGGGYRLVWPLAAGDEVELNFQKSDPTRFQVTGKVSAADYQRKSGLYATATPAASSDPKQLTNVAVPGALSIGTEDGLMEIQITTGGMKLGGSLALDFVALASKVDAALSALRTWESTHTHTSASAGSPTTPPIVAPPVILSTASLKIGAV
jgi:hypothetical protein